MYLTMLKKESADLCAHIVPEKFLKREQLIGVICLDDEKEAIGAAVVEPDEETLRLQWIYVLPGNRNAGAGALMLKGVKEMAKAMGAVKIEVYFEDENTERFFTHNDFLVLEDNPVYSFKLQDISLQALAGKKINSAGGCIGIDDMKKNQKGDLINRLSQNGIQHFLQYCKEDLSFCYMDERGKPGGCILDSLYQEDRELRVDLLMNFTRDPRITLKLIEEDFAQAVDACSGDYKISFIAENPAILGLVVKLLKSRAVLEKDGVVLRGVCPIESGAAG